MFLLSIKQIRISNFINGIDFFGTYINKMPKESSQMEKLTGEWSAQILRLLALNDVFFVVIVAG